MEMNEIWSARRIGVEHPIWFRNLKEVHALTLAWLGAIETGRPSHLLARGMEANRVNEDVVASLWMLDALDNPDEDAALRSLLDDLSVNDSLARLDRAVWTAQAWTLARFMDRAPDKDKTAVLNQLEQEAWKRGLECGTRRWPVLAESLKNDMRSLLLAAREAPWAARPGVLPYLVVRALPQEAEVELLACPHRCDWIEISGAPTTADRLCGLHEHWMRGFVYHLNTKLLIERLPVSPAGRCRQRWRWAGAS